MVVLCSQVRANEIGKYLLFCVSDVYLSSEFFGLLHESRIVTTCHKFALDFFPSPSPSPSQFPSPSPSPFPVFVRRRVI